MYRQGITQGYEVLIDTQWNVNTLIPNISNRWGNSFNRYIVECKYNDGEICCVTIGFNRYIVECKFLSLMTVLGHTCVLIDTQWNVNEGVCTYIFKAYIVLIDTQWNVNTIPMTVDSFATQF